MVRRTRVAEIPRVDDDLDGVVARRDLLEDRDRAVAGAVVDEYVLAVEVGHLHFEDALHRLVALGDSSLFVEAGRYDADGFPCHAASLVGAAEVERAACAAARRMASSSGVQMSRPRSRRARSMEGM